MSDAWRSVTKQHPCPICRKPDWCGVSADGTAVRCMRDSEPPTGWRTIKSCDDGGTVFKRSGSDRPSQRARQSWADRASRYATALVDERLRELAEALGVRPETLKKLGVGWDARGKRWTFPERNAHGEVIGIATRTIEGEKRSLKGGRRGLVVPPDLGSSPDPVLIVEGPSDVAACMTMGLTAVGRPASRGGVEHLAQLLENRANVLVVGENDRKSIGDWPGRDGAIQVAEQLAVRWNRPVAWTMPPSDAKDVRAWLNAQQLDLTDSDGCKAAGQELLRILRNSSTVISPESVDQSTGPYRETSSGLVHFKPTHDGDVPVPLTNFAAKIVADVVHDDGQETSHTFEIEGRLCIPGVSAHRFTIPAARFAGLTWVMEQLGPRAIVNPGFAIKDHARAAIQHLSSNIASRRVYTHTGWRRLDKHWVYLHGGGAIGPLGPLNGIEVDLPPSLALFRLPAPLTGDQLREAIRASLSLLDLGPDHITVPLLGAVFRSVLGGTDLTVNFTGTTGVFKTELAALGQQHFGAGFNARNLPGSWASTGNALEQLAFRAKDAVLVVDDFAPSGSTFDVARFHREADRLLRAQGNRAGRARLRPDGELRPVRSPRGLIVTTGEDVPRGQSLRARQFIIELKDGDIDVGRLTEAQDRAAHGVYAGAMASYLRWLAERYDAVRETLSCDIAVYRKTELATTHRRTPDTVGSLAVGIGYFLRCAVESEAITEAERAELLLRSETALFEAANQQSEHLRAADPARRFLELISSAIVSGEAHVAGPDGNAPDEESDDPGRWGWQLTPMSRERREWRPGGKQIGWVAGLDMYLDGGAAYKAAETMAGQTNSLGVSERTLRKRLAEGKWLASTDPARRKLTVRRTLQGSRRDVLHLKAQVLSHGADRAAQSAHLAQDPAAGDETDDHRPVSWAGAAIAVGESAHGNGPLDRLKSDSGPLGPVGPVPVPNRADAPHAGDDWGEV